MFNLSHADKLPGKSGGGATIDLICPFFVIWKSALVSGSRTHGTALYLCFASRFFRNLVLMGCRKTFSKNV